MLPQYIHYMLYKMSDVMITKHTLMSEIDAGPGKLKTKMIDIAP